MITGFCIYIDKYLDDFGVIEKFENIKKQMNGDFKVQIGRNDVLEKLVSCFEKNVLLKGNDNEL